MKEKASTALWGFRSLGLQMHGVKRWNLNPQVQVRSLEKTRKTWIFQALGNYVRVRSHTQKRQKYLFYSPYTKIDRFRPVDFLSIAKAMVYHHAQACISSPKVYIISRRLHFFSQWWYTKLRFDDMQFLRNWWYTRLSPWFMQEFKVIRKLGEKIFFVAHRQKNRLV